MQWLAKVVPFGFAVVCWSCTASHDVVGGSGGELEVDRPPADLGDRCRIEIEDSNDGLPDHLDCTGLYSNPAKLTIAANAEEFVPAHTLWSDGAEKTRWLYLPKGKTIDASTPGSWIFPVGTKAWKEFSHKGRKVETRLYQKVSSDHWARTTYEWNADQDMATRSGGKDMLVDGDPYHLPSGTECDDCHGGRKDRLLGFEQASLGLDGAEGITLAQLVDNDRLTGFEGPTEYTIGDDGSGVAAEVLGWIHMNCGVSCHNDTPNSKGYTRGMRLRLDPALLDGREPSEFEAITTTVGQDARSMQWAGKKRIVPGAPQESLIHTLTGQRGDVQQQMPPIASNLVDAVNTALIAQWITAMPSGE